ncbi:MAG TPA: aromatic amino acid lyase [Labilithrix sp.]
MAEMLVVLGGGDLAIEDVVRVARRGARVALAPAAVRRMRRARAVVDRAVERGDLVYGSTTGVAARQRTRASGDVAQFNRLLLANHRIGQGAPLPNDVVRAAILCIVNGFARGTTAARPELAERLVRALNGDERPNVKTLGSVGQADLAQNADLAHALVSDEPLAAGEALALLDNNAFSTGAAALAVSDATRLLEALEVAGALDLEAFAANVSSIHPAIDAVRPFEGLVASRRRVTRLLEGSYLFRSGAARKLQDPLTVRGMTQLFGSARDALAFVRRTLETELCSADGNPLVVPEEDRVISVWNGETPVAGVLDFLRIALAPVLTSANERIVKLLQAPHTGLPDGLAAREGLVEDALAELGVVAQSIAAEARLLAAPVSFELASTTQAEGIEDRTTMAPLAARRVAEMVGLGERLVAIELVVASQAVDLRKKPLGIGTKRARNAVRERVPFVGEGDALPPDLDGVRDLVRSGFFDDQRKRAR